MKATEKDLRNAFREIRKDRRFENLPQKSKGTAYVPLTGEIGLGFDFAAETPRWFLHVRGGNAEGNIELCKGILPLAVGYPELAESIDSIEGVFQPEDLAEARRTFRALCLVFGLSSMSRKQMVENYGELGVDCYERMQRSLI